MRFGCVVHPNCHLNEPMNKSPDLVAQALRPGALLQDEHNAIDAIVHAAYTATVELPVLSQAMQQLLRHFYLEEAIMFPPLLEAGLVMPVMVMQREHGEMWPFWERLVAACDTGTLDAAAKRQAHNLYLRLRVHNPKEEEVVYAAADKYVVEHPDATMVADLQRAVVPVGWKCTAVTQIPA